MTEKFLYTIFHYLIVPSMLFGGIYLVIRSFLLIKKIKSDWPENQKIIVGIWIFASVFIGAGTFTVGLLILLNVIKIPT